MSAALVAALEDATRRVMNAADAVERRAQTDTVARLDLAVSDVEHYERAAHSLVRIRREEATYRPDAPTSFFADLAAATIDKDSAARDRIERHARESREIAALERRAIGAAALGGLTPPQYLVDTLEAGVRHAAPLSSWLTEPLPDKGSEIIVPQVSTPMAAEAQTAENAPPNITDPAITDVLAHVVTLWAPTRISRQGIERSGHGVDRLIATELGDALGAERERQVINGSGTSGELTGLLVATGTASVTFTNASPTAATLLTKLAALATASAAGRKRRAEVFVLHSRRLDWLLSRTDAAFAHAVGDPRPDDPPGTVVRLLGIPTICSDAIPTDFDTDQDAIIAMHRMDAILHTGPPSVLAPEAGTPATIALTLAQYAAFPIRRAAGIATMTGTGLAAIAT